MRNKKTFSFNEEIDAEKLYNNGFENGVIDYSSMYLVAKYIRQTFGFGEIRLEKEIIRFCKKQDKNFNPVTEASAIKKWINSALNYDLRKIDSISVSQKEIDFLKDIKNNRDRKLLFSTLVFSKALKKGNVKRNKSKLKTSNNYYIHYSNFSDIIRLTKLTNISEIDLADIFYAHPELFTFYEPERELIRLEFVDKNPQKEINIFNLNNIAEHYTILFEKKKPVSICMNCGKEITKNSNKQKYCKKCAKEIRLRQKREWIKEARLRVDQ